MIPRRTLCHGCDFGVFISCSYLCSWACTCELVSTHAYAHTHTHTSLYIAQRKCVCTCACMHAHWRGSNNCWFDLIIVCMCLQDLYSLFPNSNSWVGFCSELVMTSSFGIISFTSAFHLRRESNWATGPITLEIIPCVTGTISWTRSERT